MIPNLKAFKIFRNHSLYFLLKARLFFSRLCIHVHWCVPSYTQLKRKTIYPYRNSASQRITLTMAKTLVGITLAIISPDELDPPNAPVGHHYVLRRLAPPGLDGLPVLIVFSVARFRFRFSPATSLEPTPDSTEFPFSLSRSFSFSRPLVERSVIFTEELLPRRAKTNRGKRKDKLNSFGKRENVIIW